MPCAGDVRRVARRTDSSVLLPKHGVDGVSALARCTDAAKLSRLHGTQDVAAPARHVDRVVLLQMHGTQDVAAPAGRCAATELQRVHGACRAAQPGHSALSGAQDVQRTVARRLPCRIVATGRASSSGGCASDLAAKRCRPARCGLTALSGAPATAGIALRVKSMFSKCQEVILQPQ